MRFVALACLALLVSGCGSGSTLEPDPSKPLFPEVGKAIDCLERTPGSYVEIVEGRALGGARGTVRFDYGEYETQIAFAETVAEAKALRRQALDTAAAMGAEGAEEHVRLLGRVLVSWGAVPPDEAAVAVIARCVKDAR